MTVYIISPSSFSLSLYTPLKIFFEGVSFTRIGFYSLTKSSWFHHVSAEVTLSISFNRFFGPPFVLNIIDPVVTLPPPSHVLPVLCGVLGYLSFAFVHSGLGVLSCQCLRFFPGCRDWALYNIYILYGAETLEWCTPSFLFLIIFSFLSISFLFGAVSWYHPVGLLVHVEDTIPLPSLLY
jgi:hypothetical protein